MKVTLPPVLAITIIVTWASEIKQVMCFLQITTYARSMLGRTCSCNSPSSPERASAHGLRHNSSWATGNPTQRSPPRRRPSLSSPPTKPHYSHQAGDSSDLLAPVGLRCPLVPPVELKVQDASRKRRTIAKEASGVFGSRTAHCEDGPQVGRGESRGGQNLWPEVMQDASLPQRPPPSHVHTAISLIVRKRNTNRYLSSHM